MPMFDYKCLSCGHKQMDEFVHCVSDTVCCPICNKPMERMFPTKVGSLIFPIDGITLEHAEANPVHFNSYKELRDYAKRKNLELGAIL